MRKHNVYFWVFLSVSLFAFVMVMIVPFLLGVYYSLTDWNGIKVKNFVGFSNYATVFSENPLFLYSIIITLVYSVLNIVAVNAVALILAVMVTQNLKLQKFYRAGFFVPNLIGGLILGYIWQFIFNRVMPELMNSDFLMLSGRNTAIIAIVITGTWQYAGYIMMIFITGIQGIPASLFEASKIDGAGAWKRFVHITLPMLAPAFTITTFLTLLSSFKQYDVNYSLTFGGPSTMFLGKAINGTELISMHIVSESNKIDNMANAQAKAVIFFSCLIDILLVASAYE